MRYADTSILLAYLTRESKSGVAEAFMRSGGEPPAVSSWTETELLSALGVKIRTRQLDVALASLILRAYRQDVAPHLRHFSVEDIDHRNASALLEGWPTALRAGAALHLAIAAGRGADLYTLDVGLADAARAFSIGGALIG